MFPEETRPLTPATQGLWDVSRRNPEVDVVQVVRGVETPRGERWGEKGPQEGQDRGHPGSSGAHCRQPPVRGSSPGVPALPQVLLLGLACRFTPRF